jgi:hypothetical protein
MKEIELTQGYKAIVDDADYDELNKFKWYASKYRNTFYALRATYTDGKHIIKMHRQILGLTKGDGKLADHINHNGLDNQRFNLRVCTQTENNCNQQLQTRSKSSRFKGVSWDKANNKWFAKIKVNKTITFLGRFTSETEAAKTYDAAAIKYHGEFACLNFPEKGNEL